MIREDLQEHLIIWNNRLKNFETLLIEIRNSADVIKNYIKKKKSQDVSRVLRSIIDGTTEHKTEEFGLVLSELESLQASKDIFSSGFNGWVVDNFINYNPSSFNYLQESQMEIILAAIKSLNETGDINSESLNTLFQFIFQCASYLDYITRTIIAFKLFDRLKYIKTNVVLIGANGSGKSTFSRSLRGILSRQIVVIPSQQLLYYKAPYSINTNTSFVKAVVEYQSKDKLGNSTEIKDSTQDDFTNIIIALKENEDSVARECYYEKKFDQETILSKVQRVWGYFYKDRNFLFENYKLHIRCNSGEVYDVNSLSDGEKAIIYYASHIFFAPENAYIIIDEPENHMHTALCDKLWNVLEAERTDCTFVYLTHNLDFAVSRNNKTIIWNKSFIPPHQWDIEVLPHDDEIPERLMTEIVGTKKNLLFCEGEDKSSVDFRLYNILFKEYTVVPMKRRDDVIRSVIAYNKNPQFHYKAFGIVDHDNYRDLTDLQTQDIYVLSTNEVENILCDEKLIEYAIEQFCSSATIEEFKENFFKMLSKESERLAIDYVVDYINDRIHSSIISNRKHLSEIKTELADLMELNVEGKYIERREYLNSLVKSKDYTEALSNCNLKKKLTHELCNRIIVNNYEDRVLELINRTPKMATFLRNKYLPQVPCESIN